MDEAIMCHEIVAAVLEHCWDHCEEGAAGRGKCCDITSCPLYRYSQGGRIAPLPKRDYTKEPGAKEVAEFMRYVCNVGLYCGVNVFRQWNIHPKYKEYIAGLNVATYGITGKGRELAKEIMQKNHQEE